MVLAPDQLLHLGPDPAGASWNHFDLGLGLSSHINYPQSQLKNSPPQGQPWWYSKTNTTSGKDVVVFSAPLGGATTSANTQYARCELREYERNGTTKMAFDPRSGDHWIEGIYRIYGLSGLQKPGVCVQQAHDPNDDVIMVRTELVSGQTRLQLRYNDVLQMTLNSSYVDGTEFYLKIRINAGTPSVYYTTNLASIPSTPTHTSAGHFSSANTGWYFKSGSYNQTNESTDPNVDQDASIIRVEVRELKHWHSQTPAGGAWPTPASYTATAGVPVPNAGADATITQTGTFSRTGSVTLNGATLTSQQWKINDGPTGDGTILSSTSAVSFNPSGLGLPAGIYVLEYITVTSAGTFSDTVTVTVTAVTTPTDTTTAAGVKGWGKPIKTEQFNYTGAPKSADWGLYDGPGHSGNGTRDPNRVTVDGTKMVGTGLNNGASFGMNHRFYQQYGKWEVRMRCFETGTVISGNRYHVVLIVWPESGAWPEDGEYDFVELSIPGQSDLEAFMHFPHDADQPVQQRFFSKPGVGTGEWHNYALEWTPNELVGYVDGVEWFRTSGGASSIRKNIQDMPSGGLTIQLDNFDGTNQTPAQVEVDWVNVYPLVPIPLDPTDPGGGGGGGTSIGTYPTFVAAGTPVSASDGTSGISVPAPPGVQSGQFQICAIECATSAESITGVPAGWQLLDDQDITTAAGGDSGDTSNTWIFYNTTGDSVSRTWTKSGTRGFHAVRMAWKDFSALGQHLVRVSSATTTTPYASPVAPATDKALAVAVLFSDRLNTTAGPVTVPTGWTSRYNSGVTINSDEFEWISVAEIKVDNKAIAGANIPDGTGLGTSNFKLTNADSCQVFSFVLEGPISTGTVYSGSAALRAIPKLALAYAMAPFPAGTLRLQAFPLLFAQTITRGGTVLWIVPNISLNASHFPRGTYIITATLTFATKQLQYAALLLEAIASLRAGALPYRRPVLRTEYEYPPENHPFRLIAQRILDGEIVEWELPVGDDFQYTEQLSGPVVMQGSFSPEMIQVQELGLDGYAYWLHVEINQQIRASAILLPPQYEENTMSFSAEGVSAVPHYHYYQSIFRQIQVDPLSVVRTLWNYVQSQPESDLGVTLSQNSSPVRIGEPARTEITTNEDGSTTTREIEAKPYELLWWEGSNVGEEIDTLSGQTPFDYVERHAWNADRTDVLHFIDLGYPRIGTARSELLFNEENILEVVPVQEPEDSYASSVLVVGAGDGEDTIRGYAAQSFGDRVRRQVVVTDKTITTVERANARALSELAIRRGRAFEASEIVIDAYHSNAPIGSYRVGDDIQVQIEIPWLFILHTAWYRITSIQNKPSSDKLRLGLARSDTLLDTSDIWIQPDDYVPFEPPPPVGPVNWNGNVQLIVIATLNVSPPVPTPTARVLLVVGKTLTVNGAVFGGSFAFVNMFVGSTLTTATSAIRVAAVSLPVTAALAASGVATGANAATATLIAPTSLAVGAQVPTGAVSLSAAPTLSASGTVGFGSGGGGNFGDTPFGSLPFGAPPGLGIDLRTAQALSIGGFSSRPGAVSLVVGKTLTLDSVLTSPTVVVQLGKTTDGASSSGSTSAKTVVSKITSSVNGSITGAGARLWVDTGTASVRFCVYSDSSGNPTSLIALSDPVTVSNTAEALKLFTFAAAQRASITPGTDYWIGFTWPDPGTNTISWSRDGTVGQAVQSNSNAPAPFGTPVTGFSGPIDAYIEVLTMALGAYPASYPPSY